MQLKLSFQVSVLSLAAFLTVSTLNAAPITGSANIGGTVTVTGTAIAFQPNFGGLGGSQTGSFAGLTGGTIMSLVGGPVTGPTSVPGFIHFTDGLAAPITFDLTYISPGVGTLSDCTSSSLGASCTPAGSPFTLVQLSSNTVLASLQLNGTAYTGSAATGSTAVTGVFSTQSAVTGTVADIYATLVSGGAISGVTYSASFVASPVPEPGSIALLGTGLLAVGGAIRRRTKR